MNRIENLVEAALVLERLSCNHVHELCNPGFMALRHAMRHIEAQIKERTTDA